MFEKYIIQWFNKNITAFESVLKYLRNMQHYYVQEPFSKDKLQDAYLKQIYNWGQ